MWKKIGYQPVSGLREIGFIKNSDFLMVLGNQGRTVYDCLTNEKVERDRQDYYTENWNYVTGIIQGIGKFIKEEIICGGFEYPDPIEKTTNDDWKIEIEKAIKPDYNGELKTTEVMYLVQHRSNLRFEINIFHYSITRAYGFSNTGNSFVIAESDGVKIWTRNG